MIGNKLRELRISRKLTQEQISKLLDIKQGTYSGYERDLHDPDLETLKKIADILMTSTDHILGRYNK